MPLLPTGSAPGLYQLVASANTDYVIPIPANAMGVTWFRFEMSTTDTTKVPGRILFNDSVSAISPITNSDAVMGYVDAVPSDISFGWSGYQGDVYSIVKYLHVASATAGAVVRGSWLFS